MLKKNKNNEKNRTSQKKLGIYYLLVSCFLDENKDIKNNQNILLSEKHKKIVIDGCINVLKLYKNNKICFQEMQ